MLFLVLLLIIANQKKSWLIAYNKVWSGAVVYNYLMASDLYDATKHR